MSEYRTITTAEHGIAVPQLCPNATDVVRRLQEAGYEAYIVGGGVRDLLLGKLPKDFDVATDATPEQVQKVFPRCRLIGRRFRLAHVRQKGTLIEVATFRGAGDDDDDGHHRVNGRIVRDNVWGTLESDAKRRDFTINALFLDPVSGDIIDHVGGYDDLQQRRLRLIGEPYTRFREDPVRLLRLARFVAKLGVEPDEETAAPIRELAPLLKDMPPARLFDETTKLFMTGHALRSMEALQRFGLTGVLFPPLVTGPGGKVTLGSMVMKALANTDQRVAEDLPVTPAFLFAALLWRPVRERSEALQKDGESEVSALFQAAEEILSDQVRRIAIPRRFSVVTRQIWTMQPRFQKTKGKRALRLMNERRFRAAYDFLLLRADEEPELAEQATFWTDAQKGRAPAAHDDSEPRGGRRRRPRRRRPRKRRP